MIRLRTIDAVKKYGLMQHLFKNAYTLLDIGTEKCECTVISVTAQSEAESTFPQKDDEQCHGRERRMREKEK